MFLPIVYSGFYSKGAGVGLVKGRGGILVEIPFS